jgi:hypothetical protein
VTTQEAQGTPVRRAVNPHRSIIRRNAPLERTSPPRTSPQGSSSKRVNVGSLLGDDDDND